MDNAYIPLTVIEGKPDGPAPFPWDSWYNSINGRSIDIPEVSEIGNRIDTDQYQRFEGQVTPRSEPDASPQDASEAVKRLAKGHGADIVGINLQQQVVAIQVLNTTRSRQSGVIHQPIEAAKVGFDLLERVGHLLAVGDIAGDTHNPVARQCRDGALQDFIVAGQHANVGALGQKRLDDGETETL